MHMDNLTIESTIGEASRLHKSGQTDRAILNLIPLAEVGSIDAMVELALIARDKGNKFDSDEWIDKAEAALKPGDLDGHASLKSAYSLCLGRGERETLDDRALYHLKQIALAENTFAQESLALHFLHGLNGCDKNVDQFEYWIRRAMDLGSSRAVYIFAEHLYKTRHQISPEIIEKLEAARSQNNAAEQLLNAIASRNSKG
jgi:TPR repeat protein